MRITRRGFFGVLAAAVLVKPSPAGRVEGVLISTEHGSCVRWHPIPMHSSQAEVYRGLMAADYINDATIGTWMGVTRS